MAIKLIKKYRNPTKEAKDLKNELEKSNVKVYTEFFDGHKHIDLTIPRARLNIEIDGIHHLTNPFQILKDLNRGYFSHELGYDTMHIPNEMIRKYLPEISSALVQAIKIREGRTIHVLLD